jgi:hypothetical protein
VSHAVDRRPEAASQPGAASRPGASSRLAQLRLEFETQVHRFETVRAQLELTLDRAHSVRPRHERLRESAFARLQARLETMPVIEQAKGILMAQCRCGPDEAFDLLRGASQSANVKVSVVAARLVRDVVAGDNAGVRAITRTSARR